MRKKRKVIDAAPLTKPQAGCRPEIGDAANRRTDRQAVDCRLKKTVDCRWHGMGVGEDGRLHCGLDFKMQTAENIEDGFPFRWDRSRRRPAGRRRSRECEEQAAGKRRSRSRQERGARS